MSEDFFKKDEIVKFIEDCRIVDNSINVVIDKLKTLKDNFDIIKRNLFLIDSSAAIIYWESESLEDEEVMSVAQTERKSLESIDKYLGELIAEVEGKMDEMDEIANKLAKVKKKAKKVRDSDLYKPYILDKYNDREKIEALMDEAHKRRMERYNNIKAED